jgi:hypothetical protein
MINYPYHNRINYNNIHPYHSRIIGLCKLVFNRYKVEYDSNRCTWKYTFSNEGQEGNSVSFNIEVIKIRKNF